MAVRMVLFNAFIFNLEGGVSLSVFVKAAGYTKSERGVNTDQPETNTKGSQKKGENWTEARAN